MSLVCRRKSFRFLFLVVSRPFVADDSCLRITDHLCHLVTPPHTTSHWEFVVRETIWASTSCPNQGKSLTLVLSFFFFTFWIFFFDRFTQCETFTQRPPWYDDRCRTWIVLAVFTNLCSDRKVNYSYRTGTSSLEGLLFLRYPCHSIDQRSFSLRLLFGLLVETSFVVSVPSDSTGRLRYKEWFRKRIPAERTPQVRFIWKNFSNFVLRVYLSLLYDFKMIE